MARYEARERTIYDIYDTEIAEAVTAYSTPEEADEAVARLNRIPVDSAADPPHNKHQGFEPRPDDEPIEVGGGSVT